MAVNKLSQIVKLNGNFKNSINLYLNLNKKEKIESYIPTKSSLNILKRYVDSVKQNKNHSTLLIGSYGKGKSHLLLILLAIVSMERSKENDSIVNAFLEKIKPIDAEIYNAAKDLWKSKRRFLPIIISGSQNDVSRSFMIALNDALKREKLTNLMPDTFFSIAQETVVRWKAEYPAVYENYVKALKEKGVSAKEVENGLKVCNPELLELSLYYKMDGDNNPLALKKLMWRSLKITNIGLEKFRQEYPSTAMESFVVSGNNVFDLEKVQTRLNYLHETSILSLPINIPPVIRKYRSNIKIWKLPKKGEKYYAGVDTGEGISSDNSVIEIVDAEGFHCLEFASNKIKPYEFAELVRAIGYYYITALLVVEKMASGHTVVDTLYEPNNRYINLYKYKSYDARGKMRKKPGFETSTKSRPILINRFVEMFDKGEVCINSKALLDEMRSFQLDNNGKIQATIGSKDDRVMAFGMALEGLSSGIYYYISQR